MSGAAPSLADVQAWLQGALMADERPPSEQLEIHLAGTAAFPASAGFGVYRRAYIARIAAAMRAQFPALCHALGQPLFDDFSADYVRLHPPESHTLHDLGRRFAAFLEEQRPDRDHPTDARERWIDFMIDLARFERQLFLLYDAPGAEGRVLPGLDVADGRLRLQPAVALGRFGFAVTDYYHAVRRGEAPTVPPPALHCVALARKDYVVQMIPLAEWEFALLAAMEDGRSFADAVQDQPLTTDAALGATLRMARDRWLNWGLFVEID